MMVMKCYESPHTDMPSTHTHTHIQTTQPDLLTWVRAILLTSVGLKCCLMFDVRVTTTAVLQTWCLTTFRVKSILRKILNLVMLVNSHSVDKILLLWSLNSLQKACSETTDEFLINLGHILNPEYCLVVMKLFVLYLYKHQNTLFKSYACQDATVYSASVLPPNQLKT